MRFILNKQSFDYTIVIYQVKPHSISAKRQSQLSVSTKSDQVHKSKNALQKQSLAERLSLKFIAFSIPS
jgi:hypothetical protein